jgi:hypothetical protein
MDRGDLRLTAQERHQQRGATNVGAQRVRRDQSWNERRKVRGDRLRARLDRHRSASE